MIRIFSELFNCNEHLSIGFVQDAKTKNVEHTLILSGDHLYRMDYMDFVQV